jgi:hypothetical protein
MTPEERIERAEEELRLAKKELNKNKSPKSFEELIRKTYDDRNNVSCQPEYTYEGWDAYISEISFYGTCVLVRNKIETDNYAWIDIEPTKEICGFKLCRIIVNHNGTYLYYNKSC